MTPTTKRFLVTGHPRSGTGYMSALMKAHGLRVGHERMGDDGVSSWLMAPPVWRVPFHRTWHNRGRLWYQFEHVIEVVRNPLDHIASVAFTEHPRADVDEDQRTSLCWRAAWLPIDTEGHPITEAVRSIVGWHRRIREWLPEAVTVRIEDARRYIGELTKRRPGPAPIGRVNAREHPPLTWAQVREHCDDELWRSLVSYAGSLGYPVQEVQPC